MKKIFVFALVIMVACSFAAGAETVQKLRDAGFSIMLNEELEGGEVIITDLTSAELLTDNALKKVVYDKYMIQPVIIQKEDETIIEMNAYQREGDKLKELTVESDRKDLVDALKKKLE